MMDSQGGTISRTDWVCAAALWTATFAVFGAGASRLGFYYDDGPAMVDLPSVDLPKLWSDMLGYVPGRNLHILWQHLSYQAVGGEPEKHLLLLHLMQSAVDGAVAAAFFFLLRMVRLPGHVALMAAALFSFWPTHGETHFWPYALPQNLLSTLFVIVFAMTSLALAGGRRTAWLWLLDGAAFFCALFTYDQVFFVLVGIVALRVLSGRGERRWRFAAAHLPYAAAALFFVRLKLEIVPGQAPVLRPDAGPLVWANILDTVSSTVGRLWFRRVALLYEKATVADWALGLLTAAALTWLALRVWGRSPSSPDGPKLGRMFAVGMLFYVAAYVPSWLWHVWQRHHFLPSIGLFAAGAVLLGWTLDRIRFRSARAVVLVITGGAVWALAAAGRGESRFWEESFALKKRLISDLEPELAGNEVLALEDFPLYLGPAYFISPHDADHGLRLLYQGRTPLGEGFAGDVSSSPAPGGLFLRTLTTLYGPEQFRYYATDRFLIVRFASLEGERIRYETSRAAGLPYEVVSARQVHKEGEFALHHAAARREGNDTVVALNIQARVPAGGCLAAVVGFLADNGIFHRWGHLSREGALKVVPLLLSDSGPGALELEQTIRLRSFPRTSRIQMDFYQASRDNAPVPLGRVESAVEP